MIKSKKSEALSVNDLGLNSTSMMMLMEEESEALNPALIGMNITDADEEAIFKLRYQRFQDQEEEEKDEIDFNLTLEEDKNLEEELELLSYL